MGQGVYPNDWATSRIKQKVKVPYKFSLENGQIFGTNRVSILSRDYSKLASKIVARKYLQRASRR